MLDKATLGMLSDLKLDELADIVRRQDSVPEYISMPSDQRLQFAIAELHSLRSDELYKQLVVNAKMKHPNATFHGIEYIPERNLDRNKLTQLSSGDFLSHAGNILVYGATGSGKSFIACCLGNVACRHGKKTLFYRMPDLIQDFECLETPQQRKRFIKRLGRMDLLIIDEWLGNKLSEGQINFIFEVIEKRDGNLPTVFSSQYDPRDWYVRLGGSPQCESVLNRILSKKVTIDCCSFNMRQHYAKKTPLY